MTLTAMQCVLTINTNNCDDTDNSAEDESVLCDICQVLDFTKHFRPILR